MLAAGAFALPAAACGTVTGGLAYYAVPDGGTSDSATGGGSVSNGEGDASACQAGEVATYLPDPYRPASGAWQGVCASGGVDLVELYYASCFASGATNAACNAFKTTRRPPTPPAPIAS